MLSDSETSTSTLPSNPPPTLPTPLSNIRTDLIETAVKFLKDPQVQSALLSKRLAFLEKKGLTPEEIDLALLKVNSGSSSSGGIRSADSSAGIKNEYHHTNKQSSVSGLIVTTAVVLGTASLLISNYKSIKSMALKLYSSVKSSAGTSDDEIKRVERDLKEEIQDLKDLIEEKERLLQDALNKQ